MIFKKQIMKQLLFSLLVISASLVNAQAPKFGYLNSQELILSLPEMKNADMLLKTMQDSLLQKGEQMVVVFEGEYKAYMAEANGGTLSKVQMQKKEEVLVAKQEDIKKYETEIQQKLAAKREALYKPVLDKVKMEIEKAGKDGGYTMIFDTSGGMILHAVESENLMEMMKTKLGVK